MKQISAASILAKVFRDQMMIDLDEQYPEYGFCKHKGYGTKIHLEALHKFGVSELHRRSFAPVREAAFCDRNKNYRQIIPLISVKVFGQKNL